MGKGKNLFRIEYLDVAKDLVFRVITEYPQRYTLDSTIRVLSKGKYHLRPESSDIAAILEQRIFRRKYDKARDRIK